MANQSGNIEAKNGLYLCNIELVDSNNTSEQSNLSGITSINSTHGICEFVDLQITAIGTYKLIVSATIDNVTINPTTTSEFKVDAYPTSVSIEQIYINTTAYFSFDLTVFAYQSPDILLTDYAIFSLKIDDESPIGNYNPTNVTNGMNTFSIYLMNTGVK